MRIELPIFGAALLAAMLVGCKAQPPLEPELRSGFVAANVLESEGEERYEPEELNTFYDYPVAAPSNPMPVYPEELLAERLPPMRIRVRVIVSEAGFVSQCSPIDPSDAVHPRFVAAIQDAVRGWRFMPLVRIDRGPVETSIVAHGRQTTYPGTAVALPFHEDYEFTFSQRDGKGVASMSEPAGSAPAN